MAISFLLCILQYLVILVLLAALGGIGAMIGIRLRKKKDAKQKDQAAAEEKL